jgi:hypothetical protein
MEEYPQEAYAGMTNEFSPALRRRYLLPWWIKTFCWIFMVMGAIVPIAVVLGLLGYSFNISLYDFKTTQPLSFLGIFLTGLYLLKGIAAYGLWTEKRWAVDMGIADAIVGLATCLVAVFVIPFIDASNGFVINFPLEPVLLAMYLIKLLKIRAAWKDIPYNS